MLIMEQNKNVGHILTHIITIKLQCQWKFLKFMYYYY